VHCVRYLMQMRISSYVTAALVLTTATTDCFRFSEDASRVSDTGTDATVLEVGVDGNVDAPAPICDRYGYPLVESAMTALIPKVQADCRIQRFFGAMPASALRHMQECMALQVGSIMRCSRGGTRIKYPGPDSLGILCRDMRGSHQALGIRPEEFDAMIEDVLGALGDAKIAATDLATIGDVLKFQRTDIVSLADAGRSDACPSESGAAPTDAMLGD